MTGAAEWRVRRGFTLWELVVVMVVLAITLGVAVPAYVRFGATAAATPIDELLDLLREARATAVRLQATVALGTAETLQRAVDAALAAQPAWAATNPQRRARVMFNFKALVEAQIDELAELLAEQAESGKVDLTDLGKRARRLLEASAKQTGSAKLF